MRKKEIKNDNEKIIDAVDETIYFAKKSITAYGLHIDHPSAWTFKRKILKKILKREFFRQFNY